MQAKIWNHSGWVKETDPTILRGMFDEILEQSGFMVLDVLQHHFNPQGYTALWLLAESHFAIHSFPEYGRTYYELSSCNMDYYMRFLKLSNNIESL